MGLEFENQEDFEDMKHCNRLQKIYQSALFVSCKFVMIPVDLIKKELIECLGKIHRGFDGYRK